MTVLRFIVAALPQILVLLFLGGGLDLIGGFNQTDVGFSIFIILFLVTPFATFIFLIVETVKYQRLVKYNKGSGSLAWRNISIILFIEALAISLFILSTFRM